ncbi:MAG: hypothetical protein RMJ31_07365 [Nitrososphaerota archaeon]|nr:hypothetical protein [Nitrososphaerota archaeon]
MKLLVFNCKGIKGISPIIGTLLMAVIVVSMGTVVVMWGTQTFNIYGEGIWAFYVNRGEALKERFIIENVQFLDKNGIKIYVRNVGEIEINIAYVVISNVSNTLKRQNNLTRLKSELYKVNIGKVIVIEYSLPKEWVWESGKVYEIIIGTARGNKYTELWRCKA